MYMAGGFEVADAISATVHTHTARKNFCSCSRNLKQEVWGQALLPRQGFGRWGPPLSKRCSTVATSVTLAGQRNALGFSLAMTWGNS